MCPSCCILSSAAEESRLAIAYAQTHYFLRPRCPCNSFRFFTLARFALTCRLLCANVFNFGFLFICEPTSSNFILISEESCLVIESSSSIFFWETRDFGELGLEPFCRTDFTLSNAASSSGFNSFLPLSSMDFRMPSSVLSGSRFPCDSSKDSCFVAAVFRLMRFISSNFTASFQSFIAPICTLGLNLRLGGRVYVVPFDALPSVRMVRILPKWTASPLIDTEMTVPSDCIRAVRPERWIYISEDAGS
mmetsp:Transcript_2894/g.6760  ORF Transcript_2894/g.6760 Transcript_2894/m.6760 type:complete len:248 (+) Transcript_2894:26-769(+)